MIIGIGIDIIETTRIEKSLARWGERWICKLFTSTESEYCKNAPDPVQSYSARFAAKEAMLKALPVLPENYSMKDMEIISHPGGKPEMELHGPVAAVLQKFRPFSIITSLTHIDSMAAAVVVIDKTDS